MCWKKKPPIEPVRANRVCLSYAICNYPGQVNDLNGCLNDQQNVKNWLTVNYPEFVFKGLCDSQVTVACMRNTIKNQITASVSGDKILIHYSGHGTRGPDSNEPDSYREGLALYDGVFWDDSFTEILTLIPPGVEVIIALDSCFAHGSTTPKDGLYKRTKYMVTFGIYEGAKRVKPMLQNYEMNYIVFAACGEDQTSTDAFIDGKYVGAFTHYWLKAWSKQDSYLHWSEKTADMIKNYYEQKPNIEGSLTLAQKIIFT